MNILVNRNNKKLFSKSLESAPAKTYYKYMFDKIFGRYRITWKDDKNNYTVKSISRIKDFEGYLPKISMVKDILPTISSYIESRKSFFLKDPIPFIVYDAITELNRIISPNDKVLEFGSGNSTLWFLNKKCKITSIEHSEEWHTALNKHVKSSNNFKDVLKNLTYHLSENDNTWNLVTKMKDESFDLILVDGANEYNNRNQCIAKSLEKLKKGGWLILDNSDHPNNWFGGLYMDEKFERKRFTGLAAMGLYISQTSFWQKK